MCCRTMEEGGVTPDSCLPNGLCSNFHSDITDLGHQTFWIESCSDPSWNSEACAGLGKYLQSGSGCFRDSSGNAQLGFCSETMTYCCNQNTGNTSCCDTTISENLAVKLPVASMIPVTTSFAGLIYTTALPTLLSTATKASPTDITASPTASSTSHYGSKLSVGAGIGIGISAAVGLFLILLALAYVFLRRRHGKGAVYDLATRPHLEDVSSGAKLEQSSVAELHGLGRHELHNSVYGSERHELR